MDELRSDARLMALVLRKPWTGKSWATHKRQKITLTFNWRGWRNRWSRSAGSEYVVAWVSLRFLQAENGLNGKRTLFLGHGRWNESRWRNSARWTGRWRRRVKEYAAIPGEWWPRCEGLKAGNRLQTEGECTGGYGRIYKIRMEHCYRAGVHLCRYTWDWLSILQLRRVTWTAAA